MNEIIIDGVNVAECDCYDNTYCLWSKKYHEIMITPKCEIVKDCYFKQLQRAKAENEKLKRLINMHLTTFDKCCVNGLMMSNNMSEVLNEQNDR